MTSQTPLHASEGDEPEAAESAVTPEQQATRLLDDDTVPPEERREALRQLANRNPDSAEVWAAYGQALQDAGDLQTAVMALERAAGLDPELYTPWFRLGIIAKRGTPEPDYPKAVAHFERALAAGAPKPQTLNELGVSFALQGKMREAAAKWQEAIGEDPEWGVLYSNLIKAALSLRDEGLVKRYLPGAIEAERFEESAVLSYGDWLTKNGRAADALEVYDQALARLPNHANLHFYRGLALEGAGQSEEAVMALREARRLAEQAGEGGRISQAVEFEIFRIQHPRDEQRFQRAREQVFGQYEDFGRMQRGMRNAVNELDPLVERHPEFWNGYFVRGVAHRRLNEQDKALADLERVLEIHPDEPNATMELALLNRDLYQFEKAADLADKAVRLAPRDPLFAVNAGLIMIEAKRCDRAWELYRSAVRMVGEENAAVLRDQLDIRCAR